MSGSDIAILVIALGLVFVGIITGRALDELSRRIAVLEAQAPAKRFDDGTELREALTEARGWVQDDVDADPRRRGEDVLARIDAAIKGKGKGK